jgi:pilus assembly protein CpaF
VCSAALATLCEDSAGDERLQAGGLMALKERLDALKRPEVTEAGGPERGLSIIPGRQPAAEAPTTPTPDESQKQVRGPNTIANTKAAIHSLLVERHADEIDIGDREGVRKLIASLTEEYVRTASIALTRLDYGHLLDALLDEVLGLGPLQPLLEDPAISEVMINHSRQVFVERRGRVMLSPVVFESDAQLRQVIDRVVSTVGRRVDESSPMCDARLRDGSRVNVVLPPLALDGPCMTIRKFSRDKLRPADLLAMGSATADMMRFLEAAVRSRLSILVSGGTSSGKTTLLNIISGYIPADERIVTIEDAAELQLRQTHVIRLEARPPSIEGTGAIEIRDLVRNALRMRPDRIVVGECRGGEALDMLQAMNTGHEGSMSTVHANSPQDAISRLEAMVLMAGTDLPSRAIQKQIGSAIDVIIQTQRVRGGARKIVSVCEVTGLTNGETQTHELFQFRQTGVDEEGNVQGFHSATGNRSVHMEHFAERGETLPSTIFDPSPSTAGALA